MTCTIEHDDGESLPRFLCRVCNPSITVSAKRAADAVAARLEAEAVRRKRADERAALEAKYTHEKLALEKMIDTYGNAAKTAIEKQAERVARLRKKINEATP